MLTPSLQQRLTDRLESTTELPSDRLEGRKMLGEEANSLAQIYPTQRVKMRRNRGNRILKIQILIRKNH